MQNAGEIVSLNPQFTIVLPINIIGDKLRTLFFFFVLLFYRIESVIKLQVSEFFGQNRILLEARFRVCRLISKARFKRRISHVPNLTRELNACEVRRLNQLNSTI